MLRPLRLDLWMCRCTTQRGGHGASYWWEHKVRSLLNGMHTAPPSHMHTRMDMLMDRYFYEDRPYPSGPPSGGVSHSCSEGGGSSSALPMAVDFGPGEAIHTSSIAQSSFEALKEQLAEVKAAAAAERERAEKRERLMMQQLAALSDKFVDHPSLVHPGMHMHRMICMYMDTCTTHGHPLPFCLSQSDL